MKGWKEGGTDFVSHILPSLAAVLRFTKPMSGDIRPPRVMCPKQGMILAP